MDQPVTRSVRPLADDIAMGIVLAGDVSIAGAARDPGTPYALRVPPDHLRVVIAVGAPHARVLLVVVVRLLRRPGGDRVRDLPPPALPPEEVLPVVESRVHHGAVLPPLVRVPLGVLGEAAAPAERCQAELLPDCILRVEVLGDRRAGRRAQRTPG